MRCKKESESSPFCILGICAEIIGSVLPVRLSVGNRFALLHGKPAERRGQERGVQGGAKLPRPPEAAKRLKPERLAEPISPAEHRRTEGGSVRSKGRAKLLPLTGGREAAEAGAFGGANKPGGTPAHRRWVGAQQGESEAPPPPGGRGAAEGRVFWRKEHSVLFSEKKPTGTPEHPEGMIRCAARKERYSPMMFLRVSARGRDSAGRSEASRSVQPAESSRSAASVSLPEVSVR